MDKPYIFPEQTFLGYPIVFTKPKEDVFKWDYLFAETRLPISLIDPRILIKSIDDAPQEEEKSE